MGSDPLVQLGARQLQHSLSLRDVIVSYNIQDLPTSHSIPTLTDQEDELRWRWSANGRYSAKSLYGIMATAGLISWNFTNIWSFSIPQSTKIFLFLLLRGKLLTKEVMLRRHFNCSPHCTLCENGNLEMAVHLFFFCDFAKAIWEGISNYLGCRMVLRANSVSEIWSESVSRFMAMLELVPDGKYLCQLSAGQFGDSGTW